MLLHGVDRGNADGTRETKPPISYGHEMSPLKLKSLELVIGGFILLNPSSS